MRRPLAVKRLSRRERQACFSMTLSGRWTSSLDTVATTGVAGAGYATFKFRALLSRWSHRMCLYSRYCYLFDRWLGRLDVREFGHGTALCIPRVRFLYLNECKAPHIQSIRR